MTLLIATAVLPVVGMIKEYNADENESAVMEFESLDLDNLEIAADPSDYIASDNLDVAIDPSDSGEITCMNSEYHIYEGLPWKLHVTAYRDPPQGRIICLWVDYETLPTGATFPECNCAIDEVTSTLDWTPAIGQAGTYYITFYVGESCYEPTGYSTVVVVVHPYEPDPQDTYEIYECHDWHLQLTAYWVPPNPEKLICLWVDTNSLPYGATFTECHCDYGEVTGDLYWHPQIGQAGEYIITFYYGEYCGYYLRIASIRVIVLPGCEEPEIPGLSINQVDYEFDEGQDITNSYIGQIKVDQQELLDYYDLTTGYLNIVTPVGWVVQNMLITLENLGTDIPYITTKFYLREGTYSGVDVTSIQAYVSFTSTPIPDIDIGEYIQIPVGDITTYMFGGYYIPTIPPIIEFPCYPTEMCLQDLDDHPNVQAACNQCAPCAVANSLQFLENTNPGTITIPHSNNPGEDGDNTLPGQLDEAMERSVTDRAHGYGVWPLNGKMKYVDDHNLQQCIKTKYQGHVDPSADANGHTVGNATAVNKGDKVSFQWIYDELCDGEDVEAIIKYPNGGLHVVELTGAGYICGKPFILHISDQIQNHFNNKEKHIDPNDKKGCDTEQFEWISDNGNGNVEVTNGDSGAGTKFVQVYSQSPHKPPSDPMCSYDKATDSLKVESTDPDGDKVRYGVDWDGDGEVDEWTDYIDSGEEVEIDCSGRTGTARVVAEDEYGAQSNWFSIKSKNNAINTPFINFLENHPNLFPILRQIFGLQ